MPLGLDVPRFLPCGLAVTRKACRLGMTMNRSLSIADEQVSEAPESFSLVAGPSSCRFSVTRQALVICPLIVGHQINVAHHQVVSPVTIHDLRPPAAKLTRDRSSILCRLLPGFTLPSSTIDSQATQASRQILTQLLIGIKRHHRSSCTLQPARSDRSACFTTSAEIADSHPVQHWARGCGAQDVGS